MAARAVAPASRRAVVTRPVGLVDLAPTFCAIAGVDAPRRGCRARRCPSTTSTPAARLRAGAHRVGQRAVRRRRAPAHDHPRRLGVHRVPARAPCTTAPRASCTTSPTIRCSSVNRWDDPVAAVAARRPRRRPAGTSQPDPRTNRGSSSKRRCDRVAATRTRWPAEDGGPDGSSPAGSGPAARRRHARGRRHAPRRRPRWWSLREPGELFLLRHTAGRGISGSSASIRTRSSRSRSPTSSPAARPGPAGSACHANGSLHVVFGNHAHRLDARPQRAGVARAAAAAAVQQLRRRCPTATSSPRTSAASLPGQRSARTRTANRPSSSRSTPTRSTIVARVRAPEPSIARLSADGDDVYVVGDSTSVPRALGRRALDAATTAFARRYRTIDGQTYGWDAVLALGARVVPRQRRGQRALRRDVPRPGHLDRAAAPRARRPRPTAR